MDILHEVIFPALAAIIAGFTSWGLAVLANWIKSKSKNDKVRAAVDNVRGIISAAVAQTAQNFVDDLKKYNEFTVIRQREAFEMTLAAVKKQLTAEAAAAINAITDDAEAWIAAEIEKAVKDNKKEA